MTANAGVRRASGARRWLYLQRRAGSLFIIVFLMTLLTGCASTREKQSFDDFYEVETESYSRGDDAQAPGPGPELREQATLSDYLVYAALNNPGLEAAFNEWKAALEKAPQVRALPDPRFTYVYYIQSVETRVGPQEQSFALMQTFPWLGKLQRRGDMALEAAEAARQKYEAEKLRLFYGVKHAYYEYYYLSRAIAVTEENIDLMSNLEAVARAKLQTGGAPYSAVVKAQVELGILEERLETLMDMRGPMAARLNAELGRAVDAYVPWPAAIDSGNATFSDEDMLNRLRAGNPELLAFGFIAAREEAAIGLSQQNYVPDITLGAQIIQTGSALNPDMEESGKDAVMATLSLNIPIWIGKYRAEEREARARLRATAKQRENRENQLVSELKMVLFNLRSAERKIDLYGDALVPKAEQALSATRTAYYANEADFFDLIEAQRTLLEFRLSYERALADRAQRLAEIEMMVGPEMDQGHEDAQGESAAGRPAQNLEPASPAD